MPLPSACAPQFRKTEVVRVDCYYLGGPGGTVELQNMHVIDYLDAVKVSPAEWALAEDYKVPVGPTAPKVVDKRDIPDFPGDQIAPPPPMVAMIPLHERRGPGGGPLIPTRG